MAQVTADAEVMGVIGGGLGAQGTALFVALLDPGALVVDDGDALLLGEALYAGDKRPGELAQQGWRRYRLLAVLTRKVTI